MIAGQRLYEKVAAALAASILQGDYAIGDRMPSERDLATLHGVSRPTIREAMIALEVDGLVEVVTGSGVYVRALTRKYGRPAPTDIGPFELLEARALVEGESAALAARNISDEQLDELDRLVAEMDAENRRDVVMSEDADQRFHMTIARATQNSGMEHVVQALWDARYQSLQSVRLMEKVRAEGIKPRIDEHVAIVTALRARNPKAAREAMRVHLRGVADMVFKATEAEAIEKIREQLAGERRRFPVRD